MSTYSPLGQTATSKRGLNSEADQILWQITEHQLSIDNLTRDQKYTLEKAYGESWKGLINDITDKSVI